MKGAEKETAGRPDVPFWYLEWRLELEAQGVQAEMTVPLASLAETWGCTPRQARRRLADLQERGLLAYQPGLGRGNLTNIRFTTSFRDELLEWATIVSARGDTTALIRLLNLPMPTELRWEASGELRQLLGWQQSSSGQELFRSI